MKRLTVLFIVLLVALGPAFSQKRVPGKVSTVVIDPGHGGNKPGAIGAHCKEKDLVLSIAQKFGKLIADNYPDVNIIYTRTSDVDIDLADRAHLANQAKADLFISIHANSHKTSVPTGVETYVMGLSQSKANMDVAKAENADILLEEGYKDNADYQGFDPNAPESYVMFAMYQNAYLDKSLNFAKSIQDNYKAKIKTVNRGVKQAELFVIYKTTMPAVLTEIGFISNPQEELYMMSDEGQGTIAECLFNAFMEFKAHEEGTKVIAKPNIDLPGYGKNKKPEPKPIVVEKKEEDTVLVDTVSADSLALVRVADSIAKVKADSIAQRQLMDSAMFNSVVYKVQFLSSDKLLKVGDKELKGITEFEYYQQGGKYRYTTGSTHGIESIKVEQTTVRAKGFTDAFVIAFYRGERICIQRAREIQNLNNN